MPELPPESVILWKYLDPTTRSSLYARCRQGTLVKLHRGAYVESHLWQDLDEDARHRARSLAVALHLGDETVFSHLSAAALWRLPRVGRWPERPHIAGPRGGGGSESTVFVRHAFGVPDRVETIDGLNVTTLATTVVDVASTTGFAHAVVVADAALRRNLHPIPGVPQTQLSRADLLDELSRISLRHGARRAGSVIDFADGRADRPGESMSRVNMDLAGITQPELQVPMLGASGKAYDVDFWWPQFNVIGEFDGKYKYTDPRYMSGRTAEQVLYDEKLREDDLRAAQHGFTRWPWATAVSPTLLRAHLARAGVR